MASSRALRIAIALTVLAYAAIVSLLVPFALDTKTLVFHMRQINTMLNLAAVIGVAASTLALVLSVVARRTAEPSRRSKSQAVFVLSIVGIPLPLVLWFVNQIGQLAFA